MIGGSAWFAIVKVVATTAIAVVAEAAWAGLLLSVTVVVKLDDPLPVGVPEIVPVDALKVSPLGNLPEVMDQV